MSERDERASVDTDGSGLGEWIPLAVIVALAAIVWSVVLDSSLVGWLVFAAVLCGVAIAAGRISVPMSETRAKIIAFGGFIVLPALLGYFAWRTSGTPQWVLRYLIAVSMGLTGGLVVATGVFRQEADARARPNWVQFLHTFRQGSNVMATVLGVISAALVIPTVLISVVNVVLRRIGASQGRNLTSNALIESQWYMYALIFITGLAYILREGVNVRVDFWFGERSSRTQSWIDLVGHCIGLLPLAYIGIKYSWPSVELSWANQEKSPDAGGLYRPPIKTALMLGFVFLAIQGVADVIKNIEYLRGHEFRQEDDNPALAGGVTYEVDEFDLSQASALGIDDGAQT